MSALRPACLLVLLAMVALRAQAAAPADAPPRPKLVVVIAVDQLAAGLFNQYRATFGHGFRRLLAESAVFPNGYQSHASTETCPGHSTLLSGRHPSATGIIANNWIDADTGANVYCVEDPQMRVPGRPAAPRGPKHLRVSMLGDWLKAADPASRVFAVSGKDRAAITMVGGASDGVFWWDDERGFNTYLRPGDDETARLAPVARFNAAVDAAWSKNLPRWRPADPRCASLARTQRYAELTIVHSVPPVLVRDAARPPRQDPAFRAWVRASPVLDRLTLDLAAELIDANRLGRGAAPDLLALGLSATDYVGHRFGNQGIEMCDQLAHLDRALGQFLRKLDGLGVPYVVVVSADHGGVDAPELTTQRGFDAMRAPRTLVPDLNKALREQLRLDFNPLSGDAGALYVARRRADAALRNRITEATIAMLRSRPYVSAVFTREEVLAVRVPAGRPADELTLIERFARSVDAERSADLLVAYAPLVSDSGAPRQAGDYVAGHGSPWNYDRGVPILFWRSGGVAFEQYLPVETVDIAPTLATLLGLTPPSLDGRCLDLDPGAGSSCTEAR